MTLILSNKMIYDHNFSPRKSVSQMQHIIIIISEVVHRRSILKSNIDEHNSFVTLCRDLLFFFRHFPVPSLKVAAAL